MTESGRILIAVRSGFLELPLATHLSPCGRSAVIFLASSAPIPWSESAQLDAILAYADSQTDGPSGLAGVNDRRPAMDRECKRVRVKLDTGFCIDITGDIVQQLIGTPAVWKGNAELLRMAVATGKFRCS